MEELVIFTQEIVFVLKWSTASTRLMRILNGIQFVAKKIIGNRNPKNLALFSHKRRYHPQDIVQGLVSPLFMEYIEEENPDYNDFVELFSDIPFFKKVELTIETLNFAINETPKIQSDSSELHHYREPHSIQFSDQVIKAYLAETTPTKVTQTNKPTGEEESKKPQTTNIKITTPSSSTPSDFKRPEGSVKSNSTLTAPQNEFYMRRKTPLADGLSQYDFIDMSSKNKGGMARQKRGYTMEEVGQHKSDDDLWMVLNGAVYDCSHYLRFHPGGRKLKLGAGKDGTSLFNKYHPWVNADALLKSYHLGWIEK
mmetsp:Transcript_7015/g.7728  ORF Transcript_7015/g.7728 Transcript_7015/m.7728 type:complete len:311 (-) Transcript_7015:301-1233(-)